MSAYTLFIPDMGSYATNANDMEDLLWHVNSARDHDGLPHIESVKELRKAARYIRRKNKWAYEYRLWINYGQGWEHEISEDTWAEMKQRLKEYRENCPEYPTKYTHARILNDKLATV